ncbi:MAG: signal peptidase II [Bacillota bacterium]
MYILLAVGIVVVDQCTKLWVMSSLPLHVPQAFIPRLLRLTYTHNRGAAFGILQNKRPLFIVIAAVVVGLLIYYREEITQGRTILKLALSLVAAGALGNLIDRALRGYVVDFLEFAFVSFPVFNVADMAIVTGVSLFVLDLIWDWFLSSAKAGKR